MTQIDAERTPASRRLIRDVALWVAGGLAMIALAAFQIVLTEIGTGPFFGERPSRAELIAAALPTLILTGVLGWLAVLCWRWSTTTAHRATRLIALIFVIPAVVVFIKALGWLFGGPGDEAHSHPEWDLAVGFTL